MAQADVLIQQLHRLADAARAGDFPGIERALPVIETLSQGLDEARLDRDTLAALRAGATRAAGLLSAVRAGLEDVRRRLSEIEAVRLRLDTYGRDGRRHTRPVAGAVTRRV